MFTIRRVTGGMGYPISVIFIPETQVEHIEPNLLLQSGSSMDSLDFFLTSGTGKFIADDLTEYPFPLSGVDFIEEVSGSLSLTIQEDFPVGIHRGSLCNVTDIPGVCGFGAFGMTQAGNKVSIKAVSSIILQIQSFPDIFSPVAGVSELVNPAPVKVITSL